FEHHGFPGNQFSDGFGSVRLSDLYNVDRSAPSGRQAHLAGGKVPTPDKSPPPYAEWHQRVTGIRVIVSFGFRGDQGWRVLGQRLGLGPALHSGRLAACWWRKSRVCHESLHGR